MPTLPIETSLLPSRELGLNIQAFGFKESPTAVGCYMDSLCLYMCLFVWVVSGMSMKKHHTMLPSLGYCSLLLVCYRNILSVDVAIALHSYMAWHSFSAQITKKDAAARVTISEER
ncbi:uncharacterized protein LOC110615631 [Manihot esculenta]|uniref:uncharacterized protein LOC110615631 n=1 Tax=Manihot esculenta TaxID=3983 RepID=UPI000B5D2224|nr:uncharacterized protein LOC110615631 [Manihot esculenta]